MLTTPLLGNTVEIIPDSGVIGQNKRRDRRGAGKLEKGGRKNAVSHITLSTPDADKFPLLARDPELARRKSGGATERKLTTDRHRKKDWTGLTRHTDDGQAGFSFGFADRKPRISRRGAEAAEKKGGVGSGKAKSAEKSAGRLVRGSGLISRRAFRPD